jgi:hypothetical protein
MAPGAARERVRVARALEELPQVSAALERGELSYSKARALTRVARAESEERLLAVALHATAAQTERLVAGWARLDREAAGAAGAAEVAMDRASAREAEALRHAARHLHLRQDLVDGSWILKGRLDPEVGMLLQKALELAGDALFRAESEPASGGERTPAPARRADAMGLLAETALRAGVEVADAETETETEARTGTRTRTRTTGRADRFQVILHVSAETSGGDRGVAHERVALRPDALLPSATRDRLACDASRIEVREAPDGTPLDVGRRTRIVPPALRRALDLRDGGCRFPGCGNRICDAHHIVPWKDGGATDLANLVLLCRRHHRLVHEGGFRVERCTDGGALVLRFVDPEGRAVLAAPPRPRLRGDVPGGEGPGEDAPDRIRADAEARGLRIHEKTNFPRWDGTRLDLGYALWVMWRPPAADAQSACSPQSGSLPCLPSPSPPPLESAP